MSLERLEFRRAAEEAAKRGLIVDYRMRQNNVELIFEGTTRTYGYYSGTQFVKKLLEDPSLAPEPDPKREPTKQEKPKPAPKKPARKSRAKSNQRRRKAKQKTQRRNIVRHRGHIAEKRDTPLEIDEEIEQRYAEPGFVMSKALGSRIAMLRLQRGLTGKQVADRVGRHVVGIYEIEGGGGSRPPSLRRIDEVLWALNATPEDLFEMGPADDYVQLQLELEAPPPEKDPFKKLLVDVLYEAVVSADDLRVCVDQLKASWQTALTRRYGLDRKQPRTLQEIGEELGFSRERARQVVKGSIENLGEYLIELLVERYAPPPPPPPEPEPSPLIYDGHNADEIPVVHAGFSTRAARAVRVLGAQKLGDLTYVTADQISELKNIGKTTVEEIERRMAEFGLKLKQLN